MSDEEKTTAEDSQYEEALAQIVEDVKSIREDVKTQLQEIEGKGQPNEKLAEEIKDANDAIERQRKQLEELRADVKRPANIFGEEIKSVGQQFVEDEKVQEYLKRGWHQGQVAWRIKGLGMGPQEQKTTITSSTVGSATSGILVPQRVRDYVPAAERRLTIRDILPSRPVTANAIEYPKENAFTNAASPQTEGSAKQEAALTFTIGTANVRTLAHWIPATAQVLDDWPSLQRIINDKLMYGLKLKEEEEILTGDGTGLHLSGLTTEATAYAGTYNVASDTNLDRLKWAILEAEDGDEEVDFIVLNPKNWYTILGIKDETNGANTGNYIVGNPLAVQRPGVVTLWGKTVVVTNTMTADYFLVGQTRLAEVFDRMQAAIVISTEHEEYFTKNMVAIRVEERIALAVYRGGAFIYGGF